MKILLDFNSFVRESLIALGEPSADAQTFASILKQNRNAKEQPKGSNNGPEVKRYLASTGLGPGNPWCMAFVYYIFDELCSKLGTQNPLPKTAGVMNHWGSAPAENKITIAAARSNPELIKPGQIFIMSRPGKGLGHTGIIVSVDASAGTFTTLEGNTNDQQSGEGDRVGQNVRKISSGALVGFIDYFNKNRTPEFEATLSKAITGSLSSPSSAPQDSTEAEAGEIDSVVADAIIKATSGLGTNEDELVKAINQIRNAQDLAKIDAQLAANTEAEYKSVKAAVDSELGVGDSTHLEAITKKMQQIGMPTYLEDGDSAMEA